MLAQRRRTRPSRHGDVEEHHIRPLLLDQVERGLAIVGADDLGLAPLQGEADRDRLDDLRGVVDHQNFHRYPSRRPPLGNANDTVVPAPMATLDPDAAAVRLDDPLRNRQAEPHPNIMTRRTGALGKKLLEQVRHRLGRNPGPGIPDGDRRLSLAITDINPDYRTRGRERCWRCRGD